MKVTLKQEVLLEAIKRGAFAALSDEAQTDSSTLSLLIKSVKIKAEKSKITLESATALVSSSYVLNTDENSVKEEGDVMVAANELYEWVSRQGNCMIALVSKDLDEPQTVNVDGATEAVSKAAIRKVGKLTLASKDSSKTGSKWSLDSYDSSQMPSVELGNIKTPLFVLPLEQLSEGIKNIGFVAMQKDGDHVFDTVSFQHIDKKMYMVTTDAARCALWNMPNADSITMDSSLSCKQMESSGVKDSWKHNLLVPLKMLSDVCKLSSNAVPLEFYRDDAKNRIYLSQPGFLVRMATAEKEMTDKYPPLDLFLVKPYSDLCTVPKAVLASRLNTVSLVNKNAIMFDFETDQLTLYGVSESGHSPCKANMSVGAVSERFTKVWNVKHFLDVLKAVNADDIKILIPTSSKKNSIKIINPSQPNVSYYSMSIERSKYNLEDPNSNAN
jgi:DNA polymerase III sliding clamp (beta) subunit (PCNA family)